TLLSPALQPDVNCLDRTPHFHAVCHRAPQQFFIHDRTIELPGGKPDMIPRPDLARGIERFGFLVRKPKTHSLFDQLRLVQKTRKTERAPEKKAAHFHRRFAHPPPKTSRAFDDEDSQSGTF